MLQSGGRSEGKGVDEGNFVKMHAVGLNCEDVVVGGCSERGRDDGQPHGITGTEEGSLTGGFREKDSFSFML